jgi:hypothetical protein
MIPGYRIKKQNMKLNISKSKTILIAGLVFSFLFISSPQSVLANAQTLSGRVIYNDGTGRGVNNIVMVWRDTRGSTRYMGTDSNGNFTFPSWQAMTDATRGYECANPMDYNQDGNADGNQANRGASSSVPVCAAGDGAYGCTEDSHLIAAIQPVNLPGQFSRNPDPGTNSDGSAMAVSNPSTISNIHVSNTVINALNVGTFYFTPAAAPTATPTATNTPTPTTRPAGFPTDPPSTPTPTSPPAGANLCSSTCNTTSGPRSCTGNTYLYINTAGYGAGQCGTACIACPAGTVANSSNCGCVTPTPTVSQCSGNVGCSTAGVCAGQGASGPAFNATCNPGCSGTWVYTSSGNAQCGGANPYCWTCTQPPPSGGITTCAGGAGACAGAGAGGAPAWGGTVPSCSGNWVYQGIDTCPQGGAIPYCFTCAVPTPTRAPTSVPPTATPTLKPFLQTSGGSVHGQQ